MIDFANHQPLNLLKNRECFFTSGCNGPSLVMHLHLIEILPRTNLRDQQQYNKFHICASVLTEDEVLNKELGPLTVAVVFHSRWLGGQIGKEAYIGGARIAKPCHWECNTIPIGPAPTWISIFCHLADNLRNVKRLEVDLEEGGQAEMLSEFDYETDLGNTLHVDNQNVCIHTFYRLLQ